MGTKLDPGEYDCYAAALPDEPMWFGLGRDEDVPDILMLWCARRARRIELGQAPQSDWAKVHQTRAAAHQMIQWRLRNAHKPWRDSPDGQSALDLGNATGPETPVATTFSARPMLLETAAGAPVDRQADCDAVRQLDEKYCPRCGLRWDVNDPEPPECQK